MNPDVLEATSRGDISPAKMSQMEDRGEEASGNLEMSENPVGSWMTVAGEEEPVQELVLQHDRPEQEPGRQQDSDTGGDSSICLHRVTR